MDITGVHVLGFSLLKGAAWVGILIWGAVIARSIVKEWQARRTAERSADRPEAKSLGDIIWRQKITTALWLTVLILGAMLSTMETAYRPKTKVDSHVQQLDQRLQTLDDTPPPVIAPSQPAYDWEKAKAESRAENVKARKDFQSLPPNR